MLGSRKTRENGLLSLEEDGEDCFFVCFFRFAAAIERKKDESFIRCQGCSIDEVP